MQLGPCEPRAPPLAVSPVATSAVAAWAAAVDAEDDREGVDDAAGPGALR